MSVRKGRDQGYRETNIYGYPRYGDTRLGVRVEGSAGKTSGSRDVSRQSHRRSVTRQRFKKDLVLQAAMLSDATFPLPRASSSNSVPSATSAAGSCPPPAIDPPNLQDLAPEILEHIFIYVGISDASGVAQCAATCRLFREIIYEVSMQGTVEE